MIRVLANGWPDDGLVFLVSHFLEKEIDWQTMAGAKEPWQY